MQIPACPVRAEENTANPLSCKPAVVDLGLLDVNAEDTIVVELHNSSSASVKLLKFRTTCDCIKGVDLAAAVPPGGEAKITIHFKAPKSPTVYDKKLYLYTDSKQQPKFPIEIKAKIGLTLELSPQKLELGTLLAGEVQAPTLKITNDGEKEVRLAYAISSDPRVSARIGREPVASKGTLEVPLLVCASNVSGPCQATVTLNTTSDNQPSLQSAVTFKVDDSYRLEPGRIDLGTFVPGESRAASITVVPKTPADDFLEGGKVVAQTGGRFSAQCRYRDGKACVDCQAVADGSEEALKAVVQLKLKGMDRPVQIPLEGQVSLATKTAQAQTQPARK